MAKKKKKSKLKKLAKVLGAGLAIAGLGRAFANRNASPSTNADAIKAMTSNDAYSDDTMPSNLSKNMGINRRRRKSILANPGINRMGKEVIKEMNRVGMVVDMSHSSERSTFEAIELSSRPIVISHANPSFWHPAKRNKSDEIIKELSNSNGMLGFSLYPHHLNNSSQCSLEDFCSMIARTADLIGIDHIGFGSDLCQDQPDSIVEWMRVGKWTKEIDYGEGSASNPGFPDMPDWFRDNRDWHNIIEGLKKHGFSNDEINKIKGENWLSFFRKSFNSN